MNALIKKLNEIKEEMHQKEDELSLDELNRKTAALDEAMKKKEYFPFSSFLMLSLMSRTLLNGYKERFSQINS